MRFAAELVDAGVDGFQDAFLGREVFCTPGAGREPIAHDRRIGDDSPVAAHDAIEAEVFPEKAGDDRLVEPEADLLVFGADRHAVIRHDLPGSCRKGGFEWPQVQIELPSGVDLLPAVGEMRVLATLLRATAGEVLGHGGHRAGTELATLHSPDEGGAETAGEFGVFTEGGQNTRPPRFRSQVDLRAEGHPEADRGVPLAGDVGELLDEFIVADGSKAECFRPL